MGLDFRVNMPYDDLGPEYQDEIGIEGPEIATGCSNLFARRIVAVPGEN
jgi:hypothetical protein